MWLCILVKKILTEELIDQVKYNPECPIAPEICIEVLSLANTEQEMLEKQKLYFGLHAQEVWIYDQNGDMPFYDNSGFLEYSKLCPRFPKFIKVYYLLL